MRAPPDFTLETEALAAGHVRIAGVDEAGRGPLAGPVVAAAVRLDPRAIPPGLDDSKALSPAARERLAAILPQVAEVAVALATVEEIDRINILRASHLAMCRALAMLPGPTCLALVDGNLLPRELPCPGRPVVGGDGRVLSIAAASILAKVTRDRIMVSLAQQFPGYGWETNAGYPVPAHLAALERLGVTPVHRRSFAPVHNILCREESCAPQSCHTP